MKRLGIITLIASVVVGLILVLVGLLSGGSGDLTRAQFGCETTLRFDSTGDYWIYIANDSDDDGACAPTFNGERLDVTVADSSGADVVLRRDRGQSASIADADTNSEFRFTVDQPGEYTLRAQSPDAGTSLAIGGASGSSSLPLIIAGLALGIIGALAGILMMRRGGDSKPDVAQVPPYPSAPPVAQQPAPQYQQPPYQQPAPPAAPQQQPPAQTPPAWQPQPGATPPAQTPPASAPQPPAAAPDPWAPPTTDDRRG